MLRAGADKVSVNTAAVQRPELIGEIAAEFGSQCVVCAIDAKRRPGDIGDGFEVYLHGGRTPTGIDAEEWAVRAVELGAGEILLTSMDRDGTREGFDNVLTRAIAESVTVPVIASGGVGTLDHLVDGVVEGGADAVLAASIFQESPSDRRRRDDTLSVRARSRLRKVARAGSSERPGHQRRQSAGRGRHHSDGRCGRTSRHTRVAAALMI